MLDAETNLDSEEIENQSVDVCKDFVRVNIYLPIVGVHVSVTGSYVLDTYYGWMEIHLSSSIEVIK